MRENARQHINAGSFVGCNDKFTARRLFQIMYGVLCLTAQIEDLLGIAGEYLAGGGESDPGA